MENIGALVEKWVISICVAITVGFGAALADHKRIESFSWTLNKERFIYPFIIGAAFFSVYRSYVAARDWRHGRLLTLLRLLTPMCLLIGALMLEVNLIFDYTLYLYMFIPFGFFIFFWLLEDLYTLCASCPVHIKLR